MTTGDISQAFVSLFDAEVKEAFQRKGALLRPCVREKPTGSGSSMTFQKTGKGTAGQKARHAILPALNLDHTPATATPVDYGLKEWVDQLDELKTNIDERRVVVNAIAMALGRQIDAAILTAWAAAVSATSFTKSITMTSSATIKNSFLAIRQAIAERDVPMDDGNLCAVIPPSVFSVLMELQEFSNSQWVGTPGAAWPDMNVNRRTWMGFHWIEHTGLPKSSNTRTGYVVYRPATGLAINKEPQTDIQWNAERWANCIAGVMSAGAVVIDTDGIEAVTIDESTALPTS